MTVTARYALGKVWCGLQGCRYYEMPLPAVGTAAPDGQIVFELDGWQPDGDGVERRIGKRRGSRSIQRARANSEAMLAGEKMRVWEVATVDGRRPKTLPFQAACPVCETVNVIDAELLIKVDSATETT